MKQEDTQRTPPEETAEVYAFKEHSAPAGMTPAVQRGGSSPSSSAGNSGDFDGMYEAFYPSKKIECFEALPPL